MVLSPAFEKALEDEIDARVNERVTKILELISKNYKIKYERLLGDLSLFDKSTTMCCGVTKSGKRCQKNGMYNGYCKSHVSQKPEVRVTRASAASSTGSPKKQQHTHTLPPLFMKGCPACESNECNKKSLRI